MRRWRSYRRGSRAMLFASAGDAVVLDHDPGELRGQLFDGGGGAVQLSGAGSLLDRRGDGVHPLRADAAAGALQRVRGQSEVVRVAGRGSGAQRVEARGDVLAEGLYQSL